jgi:hypothetical protein
MKSKEILVFVLLVTSIVAAFGGFAFVSRGETMGWVGVVLSIPMFFFVQRSMRVVRTSSPAETQVEKAAEAPADWTS